jgi:D-arabinose 1-dehydrogenase-like Zn-dependent alcohol dehydrogenase
VYLDSASTNAAEALQKLGGARVILVTAPRSKAMSELINGLGTNGKLMVMGAIPLRSRRYRAFRRAERRAAYD